MFARTAIPNLHRGASSSWIPTACRALLIATLLCAGCSQNQPASAAKRSYAFWPAFPDEPHIQFLAGYRHRSDIQPHQQSALDKFVAGEETDPSFLGKPYGVAMWNGRVYVCDTSNHCLTVIDLRNHQVQIIGSGGGQKLQHPCSIAITPDGTKYVADMNRGVVMVLDAQDRVNNVLGHKDLRPVAVAVYQDELAVCDFKSLRVEVWNRHTGQVLRTIGETEASATALKARGQKYIFFPSPICCAYDPQGNLYVVDALVCKVYKFNREGKLILSFGQISPTVGNFIRPKHLTVDREGILYVVDTAFQNVQVFNGRGEPLTFFGGAGDFVGSMALPVGVCVCDTDFDLFRDLYHPAFEPERLIVVTNQFANNRVAVYALGHLKPGKTVQDTLPGRANVPTGLANPTTQPTLPATNPTAEPQTQPAGQSATTAPAKP